MDIVSSEGESVSEESIILGRFGFEYFLGNIFEGKGFTKLSLEMRDWDVG